MKILPIILLHLVFILFSGFSQKLTIAAASDLKFAMEEIIQGFHRQNPGSQVDGVYGSSGQFATQIQQGAPFDIFFSADVAYPKELIQKGFAASGLTPYALGRIVIWSAMEDASLLRLGDLTSPRFAHIAIANPRHAPYGQRAQEALTSAGVGDLVASQLVYGENIAQTAQFVQTKNAQVGIIALSLVLSPAMAKQGGFYLIPQEFHTPLEQGFIITLRAKDNALATKFTDFMGTPEVKVIMKRYGFELPE